jgi:hypothetical protein
MKIGIIGSGAMGGTLGKLWVEAGHQVMFSSRHPQKLTGLSERALAGTVKEASLFGQALLLAVNYTSLKEVIDLIGPASAGKLIMDLTNPYGWKPGGGIERLLPNTLSGGEVLAQRLPQAWVVKAFSSHSAATLASYHHAREPLAVLYATDHMDAQPVAEQLIGDAGFEPLYFGDLRQSIHLELGGELSNQYLTVPQARQRMEAIRSKALSLGD